MPAAVVFEAGDSLRRANVCPTSIDIRADDNGPWSTILSISDINSVIGTYASR